MMKRYLLLPGLALLLPGLLLTISNVAAEDHAAATATSEAEFSEAEIILWMTDQLDNINKPGKLTYQFTKGGTLEEGFTDTVELIISEVKPNGMKSAQINFFTGERNVYVPPNENTNGNPVLAVYLQGDTQEMDRLTHESGGRWRYFHRRMKFAFSESATVEPVTFNYNGEEIEGTKVSITPFIDDPHKEDFGAYTGKLYEFYLSDQIPGRVYKIYTIVPDLDNPGAEAEPLLEEYLVLIDSDFT